MVEVTVCDWPVQRLGPAGIFEGIGIHTLQMVSMLDTKMHGLAQEAGYSKKMFKKWLAALRQLASAIIFHGGEVVSEGNEPLTVIVVPGADVRKAVLSTVHKGVGEGVMDVGVVSIVDIMPLVMPKEGGSTLRPFLSSELLVLASNRDAQMLEALFHALREAFEGQPLDDLVKLVSLDVKKEVFRGIQGDGPAKPDVPVLLEETDFSGRTPVKRRVIENGEFDRIAIRAMRKRRIPVGVQGYILPKIRSAACGN